jgi:hypothetical protein
MQCISPVGMHIYIRRLERFALRCGAPVVRNSLVAGVLGQMEERRIVLRAGLTLEQQLLTLVHELTHLIIHCHASPRINRTVCEYEAEAVEKWVCSALSTSRTADNDADLTEDLLASSVARVRWAADVILNAARDGTFSLTHRSLQSQSAVELDAAAGKEIVFNDELHGLSDFVRLA